MDKVIFPEETFSVRLIEGGSKGLFVENGSHIEKGPGDRGDRNPTMHLNELPPKVAASDHAKSSAGCKTRSPQNA